MKRGKCGRTGNKIKIVRAMDVTATACISAGNPRPQVARDVIFRVPQTVFVPCASRLTAWLRVQRPHREEGCGNGLDGLQGGDAGFHPNKYETLSDFSGQSTANSDADADASPIHRLRDGDDASPSSRKQRLPTGKI